MDKEYKGYKIEGVGKGKLLCIYRPLQRLRFMYSKMPYE